MSKGSIEVPPIECVGKEEAGAEAIAEDEHIRSSNVLGRCAGKVQRWRMRCGASFSCFACVEVAVCCVVRPRFLISKTKNPALCTKVWGTGLAYRRGQGKTPGKHYKKGSKKATRSHRSSCCSSCCSRYVPEARCSRDDLVRRSKLRLLYYKTNLQ